MNAIKEAKGLKDVPWHMFGFGIFAFPMGMDALFLMTRTPNFPNLAVQKIRYIDMFGLIARVRMPNPLARCIRGPQNGLWLAVLSQSKT